jgi:hypothetical protein
MAAFKDAEDRRVELHEDAAGFACEPATTTRLVTAGPRTRSSDEGGR